MKLSQIPDGELFWAHGVLGDRPFDIEFPERTLFRRVTAMPNLSTILCIQEKPKSGSPIYFSVFNDVTPNLVESPDILSTSIDE